MTKTININISININNKNKNKNHNHNGDDHNHSGQISPKSVAGLHETWIVRIDLSMQFLKSTLTCTRATHTQFCCQPFGVMHTRHTNAYSRTFQVAEGQFPGSCPSPKDLMWTKPASCWASSPRCSGSRDAVRKFPDEFVAQGAAEHDSCATTEDRW